MSDAALHGRAMRAGDAAAAWPMRAAAGSRRGAVERVPLGPVPLVAVLCGPARARAVAAAVALATVRALGSSCALAGVVGGAATGSLSGFPAARRAAAALHGRGGYAVASGRLVWLPDPRAAVREDVAGHAGALSAELGRATAAVGAPGAVAYPFARTAALDRVLAWHDAIVVVREPGGSETALGQALASLRELGRPVAAMSPPSRLAAALAVAGVQAPAEALRAVDKLGLAR